MVSAVSTLLQYGNMPYTYRNWQPLEHLSIRWIGRAQRRIGLHMRLQRAHHCLRECHLCALREWFGGPRARDARELRFSLERYANV